MSLEANPEFRESFDLRGRPRGIVLGGDGVHHPSSPRGGGNAFTPYQEITHLAASRRTVWLGARRSVYAFPRRAFTDARGPETLVRALIARIARRPGGSAQLARMAEVEETARSLPRLRATWVLVAACLVGFVAQLAAGEMVFEVSYFSPVLVMDGDLWRLVTANLIHVHPGFPVHLVLNLLGLVALGAMVERSLGAARAACIMAASGLAAMAASGLAGYASVVGVSGVVFGLAGAALWLELYRTDQLPAWLRIPRRAFLLLLLVNAVLMIVIPVIAGAAHVGGFAAGFLTTALVIGRGIGRAVNPAWIRATAVLVAGISAAAVGSATAELAATPGFVARHAQRLARLPGLSPIELNERAWVIAIAPETTDDELKAALLLAERAVLETKRSIPAVLDTLAEVQFLMGWPDRAIATIDEAIAQDPGQSYYREQRKRFAGERAADDRPEGPFFMPAPSPEPAPLAPAQEQGLTV